MSRVSIFMGLLSVLHHQTAGVGPRRGSGSSRQGVVSVSVVWPGRIIVIIMVKDVVNVCCHALYKGKAVVRVGQ